MAHNNGTTASDRLAITGWGVVSPIGIGRVEFRDSVDSKWQPPTTVSTDADRPMPLIAACRAQFDTVAFLGPKGTRTMDRTTAMSVAAVGMALTDSSVAERYDPSRIGVVLGTSTGSVKSATDFIRETLVNEKPYLVNPALFPNTVMNCAAGNAAIWHRLRGVNSTISAGHLSGLLGMRYATVAIRAGRADAIVAGGVEEFCEQSAWAYHHLTGGGTRTTRPLGEGCAAFVVERLAHGHDNALAEVLAIEVGVYERRQPTQQAAGLALMIKRALQRAHLVPADVAAVSLQGSDESSLARIERDGLRDGLAGFEPSIRIAIAEQVGECYSAGNALQVAALLASVVKSTDRPRIGLVTSVGTNGSVGCMLVKR
jgi:3-oxoacyl-[acyl-carrier-protein] synthase II